MCSLQRHDFILLGTFTYIQRVRASLAGEQSLRHVLYLSMYQPTHSGYRKDAGIYTQRGEGVTEGKGVNTGELIRRCL